jgi:thioredoxin-related protein
MKTPDNNKTHTKKTILALIYADWCPHCEPLKKEDGVWEEVIKKLKDTNIHVEKIRSGLKTEDPKNLHEDEKRQMDTLKKHATGDLGVRGFPTIIKIVHGNVTHFEGDRNNADEIVKWVHPNHSKAHHKTVHHNAMHGGKRRRTRRYKKKSCSSFFPKLW